MYRLYQRPDEGMKRKIQAGLIALVVTIGVPVGASLMYNYSEIFPGPSITRSSEQAERGEEVSQDQSRPDTSPTSDSAATAAPPPAAAAPDNRIASGSQSTNTSTTELPLPVGGRGGGMSTAPSGNTPAPGGGGSGSGSGGGNEDCLCEEPVGLIEGVTNTLLSPQTLNETTDTVDDAVGGLLSPLQ